MTPIKRSTVLVVLLEEGNRILCQQRSRLECVCERHKVLYYQQLPDSRHSCAHDMHFGDRLTAPGIASGGSTQSQPPDLLLKAADGGEEAKKRRKLLIEK
jgi:hypothetical protein